MARIRSWTDLTDDKRVIKKLRSLYGNNIDNVDLWVAMVSEKHEGNCNIGPTAARVWRSAFECMRAGDSHWYQREGIFSEEMMGVKFVKYLFSRVARGGERSLFRKYMSFVTDMDMKDIPRRPFFAIY